MWHLKLTYAILSIIISFADGKDFFPLNSTRPSRQPHIIFIVADDLGWNDVGWHNPSMLTPNLDRLARNGVRLNSSYVQPICTPSRSAFMSGYFPIHTGLQHGVIHGSQPNCLPLDLTLLPQKLKRLGYSTHMAGKWHLGFCKWNCTPTFRGFDSFVGFYNGAEGYFNHSQGHRNKCGYDFRFNTSVYYSAKGTYSANMFAQRAVDILSTHDPSRQPLFLYLAFQNVHTPLQVPKHFEKRYSHIQHKNRRTYCAMVSALDEAVGNVTKALEKYGFMNNTLLVFTTDNGGPTRIASNNLPLRGAKDTLWEGGTKGAGLVYGPGVLKKTGYTHTGMIHAVDWYPTFVHVAGGIVDFNMDGINQWASISQGAPSARTEFVYNIDPIRGNAAIRVGDFKLTEGRPGKYNGWYPVPTVDDGEPIIEYDDDELLDEDWELDENINKRRHHHHHHHHRDMLFNIKHDPTEHFDLAKTYPNIKRTLKARLQEYKTSMVTPRYPRGNPNANPKYHNGIWSPGWC